MLGRRLRISGAALRSMMVAAITLAAVQAGAGCNKADFTDTRTPGCQDPKACTCEEDPTQQTCKGFNGRPEFESGAGDARDIPGDAATNVDAPTEAAPEEAAVDGGDEGG